MQRNKIRTLITLSFVLLLGTVSTWAATVTSPFDAYQLALPEIGGLEHEEALVLFTDLNGELLKQARVTQHRKGGIYYVPWELLFDPLLPNNTASMYLIHNHPSGNPTLSQPDVELGSFWSVEAQQKGIKFDLLAITAKNGYSSLIETGRLIEIGELTQRKSGYLSYVIQPGLKILGSGFVKVFADSTK